MKNLAVFDIDGCCIDSTHRIDHFLDGRMDLYHSSYNGDTPIPSGVATYRLFLSNHAFRCVFITSRNEDARQYTLYQLRRHVHTGIKNEQVLMRPNDVTPEMCPDEVLKPKLLLEAGYLIEDILVAFDDRNCVVNGWRKLGVDCFQTRPGDF